MALILETKDKVLGLQRRRESYIVLDLKRRYQKQWDDPRKQAKSDHIFVVCDGEIEMSADFLYRMVMWFNKHPKERRELKRMAEAEGRRG